MDSNFVGLGLSGRAGVTALLTDPKGWCSDGWPAQRDSDASVQGTWMETRQKKRMKWWENELKLETDGRPARDGKCGMKTVHGNTQAHGQGLLLYVASLFENLYLYNVCMYVFVYVFVFRDRNHFHILSSDFICTINIKLQTVSPRKCVIPDPSPTTKSLLPSQEQSWCVDSSLIQTKYDALRVAAGRINRSPFFPGFALS